MHKTNSFEHFLLSTRLSSKNSEKYLNALYDFSVFNCVFTSIQNFESRMNICEQCSPEQTTYSYENTLEKKRHKQNAIAWDEDSKLQ